MEKRKSAHIIAAMDIFTPEKRSEVMRAIKSTNTGIERTLFAVAKLFWTGHRYRKHFRVAGIVRADLWFPDRRVAVFADGDFWHGRDFDLRRERLSEFWRTKIERNMARDARQEAGLAEAGITVVRMWGSEISRDPRDLAGRLAEALGTEAPELPDHLLPRRLRRFPEVGVKRKKKRKMGT